jgi:hypothetical protein
LLRKAHVQALVTPNVDARTLLVSPSLAAVHGASRIGDRDAPTTTVNCPSAAASKHDARMVYLPAATPRTTQYEKPQR